ncbi:Pycsar system effector family protein [uncultured Sunxiuqinia sp.]|uniref:Pycsar system effector family protein n=1 Tax=uncultured Sunxiuqinia sp. TaxID=1573825 RepID=UPI002AA8CC93|nr:Pycsar system effector family protein [uncultured Sunxiuqinia sp.]
MEKLWNKISFLLGTQAHIHENIKFADQKSLVVIIINTGLISGLYKIGILDYSHSLLLLSAVISFLCLSFGILFSIFAIWPRGENKNSGVGFSNPVRITRWENIKTYKEGFKDSNPENLMDDLLELVFDRSSINKKKYYWLKWAIRVSLVGWFLGLTSSLLKATAIQMIS